MANISEEMEKLKKSYEGLIEEKTIHEIKDMCDNGELDINATPAKIWVVNYFGNEPEKQANDLLNQLVNLDLTDLITLEPQGLFEKVYAVKDYKNQQDIIAVIKLNMVDEEKLNELYSETIDMFSINNYVTEQLSLEGTYEKEEYDPLKFKEQQEKIDDIEERLKTGEINFGEALEELELIGDGDYDKEKVASIVEKLVNNEIGNDEVKEMISKQEINGIELQVIADILKKKYKDIYNKLSEEL